MTKLKGTILLGEGYNKTKAIFNGNIDNLEVKSIAIKDSTAKDILLGDGTTLPLFNEGNIINSQYLPSYVDDVIEAPSRNDFPTIGESGKIYLDISTNSTYRWSGSTYAPITSGNEEIGLIKELIELIQDTLAADKFKEYDKEYLTFTALEDSSIGFLFYEGSEFELLYSYDRVTWSIYEEEINLPKGNKLYLKADTTEIELDGGGIGEFILTGKLDVSGNIMSIVYSDNFIEKLEFPHEGYTLGALFASCEGLYSVHNLILPATTLTNYCYYSLFSNCLNLINFPKLPATTLSDYCYNYMFRGCTSLTTPPELPATTLTISCYEDMFLGCTSLTTAPELPATTLTGQCYSGMFLGCTSLTTAPEIPAITLQGGCCNGMFQGCTSLTTAPEILPATTLADGCYNGMFSGCTSLTTAPKILPATTLYLACYAGMFANCSSLTTAPELPAKTLSTACYASMFSGCTNLNYIKMLATDISAPNCLGGWVGGVASTGTFIKHPNIISLSTGPSGIPEGWTVIEEESIESLSSEVGNLSSEINILKNRIISTTYSELKDAVTNSTLTTGQYYRITDYVTTCNGTSAKVEDASTIDPENPVDGQSRSADHLFDIIVRALSPNQLDENAVAVCNASETYYDSTFNGTVIKYSIENKYWSTEDGKGTIYYMKDHNDNECSYDFTNIEYYYAEDTTWYLTFTSKIDSRIQLNSIINDENVLPFVLLIFEFSNSDACISNNNITGNLNTVIVRGAAILSNTISGIIDNLIVRLAHDENRVVHTNNFKGFFTNVIITATSAIICGNNFIGNYSNVSITGSQVVYNEGNAELKDSNIQALKGIKYNTIFGDVKNLNCTAKDQISNNTFLYSSDVTINMYYLLNNIFNYSANINISSPQDTMTEKSYLNGNNFNNGSNISITSIQDISRNIYNNVWDININTKYMSFVELFNVKLVSMDCPTKYFARSIFTSCENLTFTNCGCLYNNISGASKYLTFEGTDAGQPTYITIGKAVTYCTFTGYMLTIHVNDGSRYLHFTLANEGTPLNTYVYNVRGSSQTNYLDIPLYGDNNLKQIYRDASGRIFYTWEDNLVKKGYYLNDNTDTEWKEIPTSEEPVKVPTIPDAVTTALSVATLDLTTRTTIATIATDETLAFTLVPAIQGEYRLVVVNSSETDITITMPTEENYQCLCGATLTIPAQTNIELIINVTDTLIYIRKG